MMLGGHRQIVASTLAEIRGVLPLVKEDVLYEVSRMHAVGKEKLQVLIDDTSSVSMEFQSIPVL